MLALKDDIFEQETLRSKRDLKNRTVSQRHNTSSSSLYSPKTCPIRIEKHKTKESCHHAYHLECIKGWLINHDDCPMCRRDYLDNYS